MKEINAYLLFDGNCREAMEFYKKALGAELHLMTFADAPGTPGDAKDLIIHARLSKGSAILMASDNGPGMPFRKGNNFSVCIQCESRDEIERIFKSVGEGGKSTMPLQDTFWGAYFGMLTDKFGVNWMFNFETTKQ